MIFWINCIELGMLVNHLTLIEHIMPWLKIKQQQKKNIPVTS